ncbi:MAG: hypothetical protein E7616_06845 [Ruminococcaceae bacterium]|nr:hypothetical protein [Oscillospiraceae bacterium]
MYSRKFGQNGLPPDYSGISFRHAPEDTKQEYRERTAPAPASAPAPEIPTDYSPPCTPRYPLEDRNRARPARKFTLKRQTTPHRDSLESEAPPKPPRTSLLGPLASHSFTMEDIVLAGLILLLLNSDCDSELLLILGFLLLVGLQ